MADDLSQGEGGLGGDKDALDDLRAVLSSWRAAIGTGPLEQLKQQWLTNHRPATSGS